MDIVDDVADGDVVMYKGQVVHVKPCRFHRIEDHNFWIGRIGRCPYCDNGSRPVHKSCIDDGDGSWKVLEL